MRAGSTNLLAPVLVIALLAGCANRERFWPHGITLIARDAPASEEPERGREGMLLRRQIATEMQKAVVIVSHDHRIREIAHRVVWLEDGTFLPDVATTRDPVCNRVIEVEGAPTIDSEGQTYHFCGHDCRKIFEADPARFDQSD